MLTIIIRDLDRVRFEIPWPETVNWDTHQRFISHHPHHRRLCNYSSPSFAAAAPPHHFGGCILEIPLAFCPRYFNRRIFH